MPCNIPSTRSPGHLGWVYLVDGVRHTFTMRFIAGVDIYAPSFLVTEAQRLAVLWQACVTAAFTLNEMFVKNATGGVVFTQGIGPYVGTASAPTNSHEFRSNTLSLTGKGTVNNPGDCSGPARTVFHVRDSLAMVPAQKYFDMTGSAPWLALLNAFNNSTYGPADFYGQQVEYRALAPVQFNAALQRKYGN